MNNVNNELPGPRIIITCYTMMIAEVGWEYVGEDRPLKKVLFDTTGFLGAQNLTQDLHDN